MTHDTDEQSATGSDEVARIRSYYAVRDRASPRVSAIAAASLLLADERRALVAECIRRELTGATVRFIDVGCGAGNDLHWWLVRGWPVAHLAGCDVVEARVEAARSLCPGVDIRLADGSSLPFPDGAFDVAHAATVFSSILDPRVRRVLFAEMERIVRPGGLVFVYDFRVRKPTNRNVTPIGRRELDALGRAPDRMFNVSPFIYGVAAAGLAHPELARLAMRVLPRTHLLAWWRKPVDPQPRATGLERSGRLDPP